MPVYPPRPDEFTCVVCGDQRPRPWSDPVQIDYPPLCWSCEQFGWRMGPVTKNPDRRFIKQIGVLADAIACTANRQIHGGHHG